MATAFQPDAFQTDELAFQIDGTPPPPVGGGDGLEKIHIGTKESVGVTAYPNIGGWQSWLSPLPEWFRLPVPSFS